MCIRDRPGIQADTPGMPGINSGFRRQASLKVAKTTAAPRAIGHEHQRESRKSLYDHFPGHFPSSNAFPSLASLQAGDSYASDRFTEL